MHSLRVLFLLRIENVFGVIKFTINQTAQFLNIQNKNVKNFALIFIMDN